MRFPFPRYPNGWFQVAYSDELAVGAVLPLTYFGKELVLFRGDDGIAHVLDAYCPHLGAHLGYGGKVQGNCVACPFHSWKFDGSGECVEVPYAKRIPPRAKVHPWIARELSGLILVWHHAEGAPPAWEVEQAAEVGSPGWTAFERRRWKVRSHNQELAENAVDSAHFHYVHGTVEIPTSQAEVDGHILRVMSQTKMRTPMGKVQGTVQSVSYGFGYAITRFTGIVNTLLVACTTPIDDDYVDVRFAFSVQKLTDRDATSTVGAAFMREIERQLEQDIPIWENKVYVNPPLLCEGDGPIGLFRRWCKQFYSEPSARPAVQIAEAAPLN